MRASRGMGAIKPGKIPNKKKPPKKPAKPRLGPPAKDLEPRRWPKELD